MGRIKSAWEIALEKTADIQFDADKFRTENLIKEGRTLAGSYLINADMKISEVSERISSYSDSTEKCTVLNGMSEVVMLNLALPQEESYKFRFKRLTEIAGLINPDSVKLMNEIENFFSEYISSRDSMVSSLEQQIRQAMQSNPQSVNSEQYSQIIKSNLDELNSRYSDYLESSKEQVRALLVQSESGQRKPGQ